VCDASFAALRFLGIDIFVYSFVNPQLPFSCTCLQTPRKWRLELCSYIRDNNLERRWQRSFALAFICYLSIDKQLNRVTFPRCVCVARGAGVLPYITYKRHVPPNGVVILKSWFRTGYPFQRRFLEQGIIFRTLESSSFVSSHIREIIQGQIAFKNTFQCANKQTVVLLLHPVF